MDYRFLFSSNVLSKMFSAIYSLEKMRIPVKPIPQSGLGFLWSEALLGFVHFPSPMAVTSALPGFNKWWPSD